MTKYATAWRDLARLVVEAVGLAACVGSGWAATRCGQVGREDSDAPATTGTNSTSQATRL